MALTFTWKGGDGVRTIGSELMVGFYGTNFGDSIVVEDWQSRTHATPNGVIDSGSLPNVTYTELTKCNYSGSQGSDTNVAVNTLTSGSCTLWIRASGSTAFKTQNAYFWAHASGSSGSVAPGTNNRSFEQGDAQWTDIDVVDYALKTGMLALSDQGTNATTHDYYISLSFSPTSAGTKSDLQYSIQLEYY